MTAMDMRGPSSARIEQPAVLSLSFQAMSAPILRKRA
jgi:hypothetical protein